MEFPDAFENEMARELSKRFCWLTSEVSYTYSPLAKACDVASLDIGNEKCQETRIELHPSHSLMSPKDVVPIPGSTRELCRVT